MKHLEDEVASLWSVVRQLEAKVNSGETGNYYQLRQPSKNHPVDPSNDISSDDAEEFDSDASGLSTTNTPSHLLNLFDNGLLDSKSLGVVSEGDSRIHHHNPKHSQNITTLRELMPSREIMVKVVAYASPWLSVYNLVFPQTNIMRTGEQFLARYDKLSASEPDLLELSSLLIAVALTVQQFPDQFQGDSSDRIRDTSAFIVDVNELLERVVINDDVLAGTLDGISTSLLFLRL